MVDWRTVDMRRIQIKQPPGERNALGSIKFLFPNPYAVYLHDTPSKSLFQKDYRAYSHGCMRVMNPWDFADALLTYDPTVSADGLKKLIGGPERQVNLTRHIPVHITYFTAWVDDSRQAAGARRRLRPRRPHGKGVRLALVMPRMVGRNHCEDERRWPRTIVADARKFR